MDTTPASLPVLEHSSTSPPPSTNINPNPLSSKFQQLSLTTAASIALPASSPIAPHIGTSNHASASPSLDQSLRSSLRRIPSSSSLGRDELALTPPLRKRTSLSSLKSVNSVTPPRSPAFRRTSANFASPHSGMGPRSSLPAAPEEPSQPPLTAAAVAQTFFKRELEAHHGASEAAQDYETVVILQDNCYGHRFSRPRTSRAGLNTIVERPERIHACVLGLATAYVRLGGRHADGAAAPHPDKDMSELSIPFRIQKTTRTLPLTSQAAAAIHSAKWMSELSIMCDSAETKLALNGKELVRPSVPGVSNGGGAEPRKLHEGDLYLCSTSLSALEGALGGVCEGVDAVFAEKGPKRAFVCIRPPGHHCSADYPSGFCWLNNVHVGIGHASLNHGLTHVAIIDFDLHHGDGSQSITWEHNSRIKSLPKNAPALKKTAIGYFSLHDINSYPCEDGEEEKVQNASLCLENAHGQTIWNVHLQPWKTEAEFWHLYKDRYMILISKARAFLRFHTDRLRSAPNLPKPKAAIFLSAGFDASEWESPGMQRHQVNVPTDFYARFTRDVVQLAEEEGLSVDGRVISVLEGGYSDRALMSGVLSHLSGLTATVETSRDDVSNGLGHEMGQRLGKLDLNDHSAQETRGSRHTIEPFDTRWWALSRLEEAENLVNPPAPLVPSKKPRNAVPPTYSSATQSYTAKVVSSPQGRRSLSSSGSYINPSTLSGTRPPSPPPPSVDWATAAHELSKLLIPSDRLTRSCKPEELSAEASRARRDRHSTIGVATDIPAGEGKGMQLRDRKSRQPKYESENDEEKPPSRSSRRKTIADVAMLDQDLPDIASVSSQSGIGKPKPTRRRLSVASSVGSDMISEASLGSLDLRGRQDPLIIRKNRAQSNPPTEASKARAVKKPPPVPRVPSGYSVASKPSASRTSAHLTPALDQAPPVNEDLDHVTSGMKKMSIKLNVPSKQEQEAREAKLKPVARARPKSAAPRMKKIPEVSKSKELNKNAENSETTLPAKTEEGNEITVELPTRTTDSQLSASELVMPMLSNQETPPEDVPSQQSSGPPQPSVPSFVAPPTTTIPDYVTTPIPTPSLPKPKESTATTPLPAPPTRNQPTPSTHIHPTLIALPPAVPTPPSAVPTPPSAVPTPKSALPTPPSAVPTPQTAPPTPKRTPQALPIFTSTSTLTFRNPATAPAATASPGINDLSTTYADPNLSFSFSADPIAANRQGGANTKKPDTGSMAEGMVSGGGEKEQEQEQEKEQEQEQDNIWSVPSTPRDRARKA